MAKHVNSSKCVKCQEMLYNSTQDGYLRLWFEQLQEENNDIHIAYGYRNKKEQDQFFRDGKSKAKYGQSPHNYVPCMALDIFFLTQDGKYSLDVNRLKAIANDLPSRITWGGNFHGLVDMPHFEITAWKSLVKNFPNGN